MTELQTNQIPTKTTPTATAWHSRAAGDISTWAEGYNPSSERAAGAWKSHRHELEPLIAAAPAAGVTESRRIASAVLELVAWAMPLVNDLDRALSEDLLHRFLMANPTGLSDGALGNVRGRVRRVLKARTGADTTPLAQEAPAAAQAPATADVQSSSSDEPARTDPTSRIYQQDAWSLLITAAEGDALLDRALRAPDEVNGATWTRARAAAARLDVDLTKARLRRTLHAHALSHPMPVPLGEALRTLGATRRTATDVAPLLPPVDAAAYRVILRGEPMPTAAPRGDHLATAGHCTRTEPGHGDDDLTVKRPRFSAGPIRVAALG